MPALSPLDRTGLTAAEFNRRGIGNLPGLLGIIITQIDATGVCARMPFRHDLMASNGYMHAGAAVTLADTCCGYGCVFLLPERAAGFTTVELKSNHLGTARDGLIECVATPAHIGKSTQVWDAVVSHRESGKTIALFRCTQMVLYRSAG